MDDEHYPILGTPIRLVTVPVRPGRDMGAMLEMAARNELLRRAGKHSARELLARLEENAGIAPEMAIEDQPESVALAPISAASSGHLGSNAPPPPNSSVAVPGWSDSDRNMPAHRVTSNESSAWIPVYRPDKGSGDG